MIECVSLNLAKKLKKIGYKQQGSWWWDLVRKKEDCDIGDTSKDEWQLAYEECYHGDRDDLVVAPTIAELLSRITKKTHININISHDLLTIYTKTIRLTGKNLVNSLAKIYIYLVEEGIL